ncbi:hypothetical protein BXZ70DRAFT_1033469 [Cristinia sonorae]|uniref:Uncharacterized protein n=1 Tax=Cristinia sonorae TaxID=1940300 RepID=A0A8K0UKX5_9AGAR|nr:hypothetical protein BXZ70DRAFT_1033469 [Cristinia sonorae]
MAKGYKESRPSSVLQRAQRLSNLAAINLRRTLGGQATPVRENTSESTNQLQPGASSEAILVSHARHEKERGDGFQSKLAHLGKKLAKVTAAKANIEKQMVATENRHTEALAQSEGYIYALETRNEFLEDRVDTLDKKQQLLLTERHASRMRDARAPAQTARAVAKERQNVYREQDKENQNRGSTITLKDQNGIIPDQARSMVMALVAGGIPESAVPRSLVTFAEYNNLEVIGCISARSVGRIVGEGGVAAQIQAAGILGNAEGITMSGDGTTHRHINYESRHATVVDKDTMKPITITLGITSAIDHRSATQMQGLKDNLQDICDIRNGMPSVHTQGSTVTPTMIGAKIVASHSDHANDQKLWSEMVRAWKVHCDRVLRGENAMESMSEDETLPMLCEEVNIEVSAVGGLSQWEALSQDERDERGIAAYRRVCAHFGQPGLSVHFVKQMPIGVVLFMRY